MRGLAIVMASVAALAAAAPAAAKEPRLSPADRAAINETLDVFVNHAVKRKDVAKAYDVATPTLSGGMTRAQWSKGQIPVYPYPAAGTQFHKWTIQYKTKNEIGIELILSPRARYKRKLGQYVFHVYLQPRNGKWLVDGFMLGATFAPEGKGPAVLAAADFQASEQASNGTTKTAQVSEDFLLIPFAILGLLLSGLAAWGVTRWFRARRLYASSALPPSPLSIPSDGTRARPRQRP
jgi:hypothetical protein